MIHFSNAPLANSAVVRPWRSISLASIAHSPVVSLITVVVIARAAGMYVRKVHFTLRQWHDSWIAKNCLHVWHHQHQNNRIKNYYMECSPKTVKSKYSYQKKTCKFQISQVFDLPVQHCVDHNPPHHNIIRIEDSYVGDDDTHHSAGILHKHNCLSLKLSCLMTVKTLHFSHFLVKKRT